MKLANQRRLREKYPVLYSRNFFRYDDSVTFEVGDGWFDLINAMSEEIVESLWSNIPSSGVDFGIIGEEYGLLTCTALCDTLIGDIIAKYTTLSSKVCDVCGKEGTFRVSPGKWISVRCETHKPI